jgi:hypothetical protein
MIHVHKAGHGWDWTAEGDSFAGICIAGANGGSDVPCSPMALAGNPNDPNPLFARLSKETSASTP